MADQAVSASEANQRFSEMLREVQQGQTFIVTSRGRPVARMTPVDDTAGAPAIRSLLGFLETLPVRQGGDWTRDDLYA
jgi:prevent-host-death family protein